MAINVAYKVPAALMQAEKEKEERQFQRQLTLQKNQQKFQEKMANAAYARQLQMQDNAYARQLENRQYNADRQDAMLADQRQYQAEQQQRQWDRQDSLLADQREYNAQQQKSQWDRQDQLRREQAELDAAKLQYADQQRQAQMADNAMMKDWQTSMVQKQVLEKNFAYSDDAQAELQAIQRDKKQLIADRDTLTPEQYSQASWQLRMREAAIKPDVPIVKQTPQQEFEQKIVTDPVTGVRLVPKSNGEYEPIYKEQDTVQRKEMADMMKVHSDIQKNVTDIVKELFRNGTLKSLDECRDFIEEETQRLWNMTPYGQKEIAANEKKESLKSHEVRLRDDQRARRKAEMEKQNEIKNKVNAELDNALKKKMNPADPLYMIH